MSENKQEVEDLLKKLERNNPEDIQEIQRKLFDIVDELLYTLRELDKQGKIAKATPESDKKNAIEIAKAIMMTGPGTTTEEEKEEEERRKKLYEEDDPYQGGRTRRRKTKRGGRHTRSHKK